LETLHIPDDTHERGNPASVLCCIATIWLPV